ncbi:MAG: bifunctional oligoribonuclease/PAP phosphatase NrnA [Treponema sp.]|nr:bifunctional oligoribonuclease/PAP phosphatase NrnA [Treponema sp.]MBQ2552063.1 bifunctional oligoribonuclease/PAP phosphatase NrnA [Treponema sp.]MBQ4235243.1 bifunctional oligoribonuclease/PAP phosphatase NrnA [Treponema sp.]MBQ5384071.1 bifunctional oligoribonuclease/PAP phosphatase NrnA [Treponema sp.]
MLLITEQQIESFKKFLSAHQSFIVAGHKEPDGDCIACSLGMSYILRHFEKKYTLLNAGPFKKPESRPFEKYFQTDLAVMTRAEKASAGLILVDCSEHSRTGDIGEELKGMDTFIVDHHKTASVKGNQFIIDSTAPAAACLVQQLFEALVGKPSKEEAHVLFFGMATDTGFFRFMNEKDSEAFRSAARLTEAGVSPREIYQEMTGGKPWSTRKLLAIMLERVERYCNGKLAVTYEEQADTRKYGQEGRDSDALYSLMLSTEGIEAVLFMRQDTDRTCTAGFRSLKDCDVSEIAAKFGGGGHKNASGASMEGQISEMMPKIIKEFEKVLI